MPPSEPWTIGRLLQWTVDYLKQRGADEPRLDAEVLLAHALGCRRIDLNTRFDETPAEQARVAFRVDAVGGWLVLATASLGVLSLPVATAGFDFAAPAC
jgi:hypothetical protein